MLGTVLHSSTEPAGLSQWLHITTVLIDYVHCSSLFKYTPLILQAHEHHLTILTELNSQKQKHQEHDGITNNRYHNNTDLGT